MYTHSPMNSRTIKALWGVFIDSLKYLNKRLRVQLSFRFEIIKRTSSHRLCMCSMEISISFCRDNSYSRWAACSCAFVSGCPIHSDLWLAFPSLILFCVLICFFVMIMANLQNLHLEIGNPRKWSPREGEDFLSQSELRISEKIFTSRLWTWEKNYFDYPQCTTTNQKLSATPTLAQTNWIKSQQYFEPEFSVRRKMSYMYHVPLKYHRNW